MLSKDSRRLLKCKSQGQSNDNSQAVASDSSVIRVHSQLEKGGNVWNLIITVECTKTGKYMDYESWPTLRAISLPIIIGSLSGTNETNDWRSILHYYASKSNKEIFSKIFWGLPFKMWEMHKKLNVFHFIGPINQSDIFHFAFHKNIKAWNAPDSAENWKP